MAVCASKSLPLSLDDVGEALGLDTLKDKRGKYLIQALCKKKAATKKLPERYNEDFALYQELYDYCVRDVDTEYALHQRLAGLPDAELKLWQLDQKINLRGVTIDTAAVRATIKVVERARENLEAELFTLTDGMVASGNQVAVMREWLEEKGLDLADLRADTVEIAMGWEMPAECRRLLEIRQSLSKNSTSKLTRMLDCVCADGRARGMLQFGGAHRTNRWAGRLIQPQNFPRGTVKMDMDVLVNAIHGGWNDVHELFHGSPMDAAATALRGMLTASEGSRLLVADFAQIEARVLAVLAKQLDLLASFEAGEDVYAVLASRIYGRAINKDDDPRERFVGKEAVLGLGYQMGANRFFDELEKKGAPQPIEFCENVVQIYRGEYDRIPKLWRAIEGCCIRAVLEPGKVFVFQDLKFRYAEDNLQIKLPSDRVLYYYQPKLHETTTPWGAPALKLSYMGYNNKTGAKIWGRISTYGGMLTENIVQAVSRDLMALAMLRLETNGFPVILTVHDEVIAELPLGERTIEEFVETMEVRPKWANDYPIKAEGWEGFRYRK
ncbi:MAG: DNA polymerase [Pseudohongiellaceae bacterium]